MRARRPAVPSAASRAAGGYGGRVEAVAARERDCSAGARDPEEGCGFFRQAGKSMRFGLVDAAKKDFPAQRLCKVLGVSASGYFCDCSWNRNPATGLICIQSEPWRRRVHIGLPMTGGLDWNACCGNDREDTAGLFFAREGDQGDLPGLACFAESGPEGHPVERHRVSLRALAATVATDWSLAGAT